ncbi:histidine kinase [Nocardioides flavescens]|uniref:histidine kinase n=1 Tax=Nocardioides flavescens TaxID=2691959 RepID=A0A6L7EVF7_9ACTN|nr:sensor histidine kinase [Nocardioides flavescens]
MTGSLRVVAPTALTILALVGAALGQHSLGRSAAGIVLVAATALWAGLRGSSGWPLVAALAGAAAGFWLLGHAQAANLGWFGYSAVAGWAGTRAGARPTAALTVALVAVLGTEFAREPSEAGWFAWAAGAVFAATACSLARRQGELLEELRDAQAGLAERTRTEERHRIAGEMHDVIGHALTVSLLHVGTARLALEEGDTEEAVAALELAESQSRRSLEEVRSSVGLLRTHDGEVTPLPGAGDLDALVESFRAAGARVDARLADGVRAVPAATGLAAYRIVQEALTNAARHAPGHLASVRVDLDGEVRIVVESDGPPGPRPPGSGVTGMRERAEAVGGRLSAGPGPGGGWRVEAVL